MTAQTLLHINGIEKSFGGIQALRGIDLEIEKAEIHAVVGENGAGKTTLMKILTGHYQPNAGTIHLSEQLLTGLSPWEIQGKGIQAVHQKLNVVPSLSVGKNILLGRMPTKFLGMLDWKAEWDQAEKALKLVNDSINMETPVGSLGIAERQQVNFARALVHKPSVLILDEPTARLGMEVSERLFSLLRTLQKEQSITIIYISHRLEEIFEICDRITVLRDGSKVITEKVSNLDEERLVKHMLGHAHFSHTRKTEEQFDDAVIQVDNLNYSHTVKDISFEINAGEIVGLVGAVGAGKSEVLGCIFGDLKPESGSIKIGMQDKPIKNTTDAVRTGIAYVPEERSEMGLIEDFNVAENLTFVDLKKIFKSGFLSKKKETTSSREIIEKVKIVPEIPSLIVRTLSGGNQQKVVIGKWLVSPKKVFLLDEVSAGVDVGAKAEIHKIIDNLAKEGAAVLISTSDLREALGLCDRLLVMHRGEIVKQLNPDDTSREELLKFVMGGGANGSQNNGGRA